MNEKNLIFAPFKPKNTHSEDCGYFYSYFEANICKDKRLSNPVQATVSHCSCSLARMGGDSLSCYVFFSFVQMPKNNENATIVQGAKVSALNGAKSVQLSAATQLLISEPYLIHDLLQRFTELKDAFNIEKDCKNRAYSYILQNGLLEHYAAWSRSNHSKDWHETAISHLVIR